MGRWQACLLLWRPTIALVSFIAAAAALAWAAHLPDAPRVQCGIFICLMAALWSTEAISTDGNFMAAVNSEEFIFF